MAPLTAQVLAAVHILWATACNSISVLERGVANIEEAGLNTFIVDDLPTDVDFTVALMVNSGPEEIGEQFEIPVELWDPDGVPVRELDLVVEVDPPEAGHPPSLRVTDFHAIDVAFEANTEGTHSIEIRQPGWKPNDHPDAVKGCPVFFFIQLSREGRERIYSGEDP
jgi:hypothetical protein